MEHLYKFLNTQLMSIGDQQITVGAIMLIPIVVIAGLLLARWLEMKLRTQLTEHKVSADCP